MNQQPRRDAKGRTRNRGKSGGPRKFSATTPAQRSRSADPARLTAFQVLRAVSEEDAYANLVLPKRIRANRLNKTDAGFATELTYGSLRNLGTYDAILAVNVDRPLEKLDPPVLDALRLGTHQLMNMRVPAHAALNTTVGLVRSEIGAGASGLVNAVLRKVSEKSFHVWLAELAPADSEKDIAIRTSHPQWIIRAVRQAMVIHGRNPEDFEKVLEANNLAPELNLIALPGIGDLEPAIEIGARPSPLVDDAAIFSGGDAGRIPGIKEGTVRVQDVGSQLCARALLQATEVSAKEQWLDMAAGPGGKATLMASLAQINDAEILANEVSEHRTELVEQALRVIDSSVWTTRTGDGRTLSEKSENKGRFDRILLDAPCTGLGALRRRPESRWRRTPQDLANLTLLQKQLLESSAELLAPGGTLAYVTCSPHPAETTLQVQTLLKNHPELELLDTASIMAATSKHTGNEPALEATQIASPKNTYSNSNGNSAQLWPDTHSTDAMFIALISKPATQEKA